MYVKALEVGFSNISFWCYDWHIVRSNFLILIKNIWNIKTASKSICLHSPCFHLQDNNLIDVSLNQTRENKYLYIKTKLIFHFCLLLLNLHRLDHHHNGKNDENIKLLFLRYVVEHRHIFSDL